MIPEFHATVAEIGDRIALVSLSGELDLYEAQPLKDALATADKLAPHAVVVDLSGVSFLDSTACGIFVAEANRLRRADGRLVLVSNGNRASRVLQVSGIDQVVSVYETLHDAFGELLLEPIL